LAFKCNYRRKISSLCFIKERRERREVISEERRVERRGEESREERRRGLRERMTHTSKK
jgi:hypothetical protein